MSIKIKTVSQYTQKVNKTNINPLGEVLHTGNLGIVNYATELELRGKYKKGGATDKQREAESIVFKKYPNAKVLVVMPVLVFRIGE